MGSRKHKKHHKSDRRDRIPEGATVVASAGSSSDQPHQLHQQPVASGGGIRLVLKVGGSSASEHGDSPHPELVVSQPLGIHVPAMTTLITPLDPSTPTPTTSKHKKAKKKKKKKSMDKDRDRDNVSNENVIKKHKHHHHHHHHDKKEKRKRDKEGVNVIDASREYSIAETSMPKHHHHHHHHPQQTLYEQEGQYDGSQLDYGGVDRPFREPRACTLKNRQGKTPLQHLLEYLLKALERKDPHQFFAWPVTDNIAPGYSSIIACPMDFSSMRTKIDNNEYPDMDEFKADIKLMCDNAMTYNRPDTIYYKSAKKLFHVGAKITSKEKLLVLRNTLTYINELGKEELGFEPQEPTLAPPPPPPPPPPLPLPISTLPQPVAPIQQPLVTSMPPTAQSPSTTIQNSLNLPAQLTQLQPLIPMEIDEPGTIVSGLNVNTVPRPVEENIPIFEPKKKLPKPIKLEDVSDVEDEEDVAAAEILAQAKCAAKAAADRLTLRRPNSKFGFLRQNNDGSTSLAILNPDGTRLPGKVERHVNLEMLVGKLANGGGSIAGFKEDKRNIIKPVNYLSYGSFGSYAPSYDSTFANITKAETELLYSTYGDETGVQYAESLINFSNDCEFVSELADSLLNALTDGDHSRTSKVIEMRKKRQEMENGQKSDHNKITINGKGNPAITNQSSSLEFDFNSLRTLADEGIDISFLDNVEKELKHDPIQKKLDETSSLLSNLVKVQHARLSAKPPAHLSNVQGPSVEEIHLATKLTDGLVELSKKATPGDVISPATVHKAMGISLYSVNESDMGTVENGVQKDNATTTTINSVTNTTQVEDENYRLNTTGASTLIIQDIKPENMIIADEDSAGTTNPSEVPLNSNVSDDNQTNDLEMELREFLETGPTLRVSGSPNQMDVSLDDVMS